MSEYWLPFVMKAGNVFIIYGRKNRVSIVFIITMLTLFFLTSFVTLLDKY